MTTNKVDSNEVVDTTAPEKIWLNVGDEGNYKEATENNYAYEEDDLEQDSDEAFAICCDASTSRNLGGCGASSGYELDVDHAKLKWNDRSNLPPANAYESVDIIELKRRVHSAIEHATDYETEISENAKQAHARVDLAFSLLANPSPNVSEWVRKDSLELSKMKVFTTSMRRYGNPESHHYLLGVYTTKEHAVFAGDCEVSYRGGKYEAHIEEFELDTPVAQDVYDYHIKCVPPKEFKA